MPRPCALPSSIRRPTRPCAAFGSPEHAALLVEWQTADAETLDGVSVPADLPLSAPARLTRDATARAALWHIRKGLYASVAGARPSGTTALLEDIAVPVPALAQTCAELTTLMAGHGYQNSVIFGHAKDGNLHFMLTEEFRAGEAPRRYADFTEDLVDLVLAQGGTLKAEHGTGRVMAPFVRRQYGDELYSVMRELKTLCDPPAPSILAFCSPTIPPRTCRISRSSRRSNRKSTAASSAATANRSARARI